MEQLRSAITILMQGELRAIGFSMIYVDGFQCMWQRPLSFSSTREQLKSEAKLISPIERLYTRSRTFCVLRQKDKEN